MSPVPADSPRSRRALARGFTAWFTARDNGPGPVDVTVTRPQPGLSSDTLMLTVVTQGTEADYVARLPPAGPGLFPDYDLARQRQVQAAVGAAGIPVAEPLAFETDESWIGAPFLLMPRISGHTLTTSPSYLTEGWLAKQPAEQQQAVIRRFVEMLATIHRLPADSLGADELTGGGPELSRTLDHWERYLDWATTDADAAAIYRQSLAWCRYHLPARSPEPGLLWGDPQLVNLVLDDDGEIAAVLDWEMAGRGPAELDLSWFLVLHEHAAETAGTELPGYPGREQVVEWYEAALGRPVADLEWYDVHANIRSGAIVLRIATLMEQAGHSSSWTAQVPQPRHLARLIGAG